MNAAVQTDLFSIIPLDQLTPFISMPASTFAYRKMSENTPNLSKFP